MYTNLRVDSIVSGNIPILNIESGNKDLYESPLG